VVATSITPFAPVGKPTLARKFSKVKEARKIFLPNTSKKILSPFTFEKRAIREKRPVRLCENA
jgi:hypothetical protein